MNPLTILSTFLLAAIHDHRIGPVHISLYVALLKLWQEQAYKSPFTVTRKRLMPLCKISGIATYHEKIKDLHTFGYISYAPSYNSYEGSQVSFRLESHEERS